MPRTGGFRRGDGDNWPGQVIDGRYFVRDLIGHVGDVRTYRARDEMTGEFVALKRFQVPDLGARFLVRFRANSYRVASLRLSRLVAVLDYGLIGNEAILAMEWMASPTLAAHLAQRGQIHAKLVARLALWLADALADLHSHGVLHLGLTPGNIFLDQSVGLKVSDAGLARVLSDTGLTMTGGNFARNLPYLAPEQLTYGIPSPATDVYAFGVTIFQMLTGDMPYPARNLADYRAMHSAHTRRTGPPLPSDFARDISQGLDTMIALCLHEEPARRPADGIELAQRLREALRIEPEPALTYVARATSLHRAVTEKHRARRRQTGHGAT